jgi:hypothetical protein
MYSLRSPHRLVTEPHPRHFYPFSVLGIKPIGHTLRSVLLQHFSQWVLLEFYFLDVMTYRLSSHSKKLCMDHHLCLRLVINFPNSCCMSMPSITKGMANCYLSGSLATPSTVGLFLTGVTSGADRGPQVLFCPKSYFWRTWLSTSIP